MSEVGLDNADEQPPLGVANKPQEEVFISEQKITKTNSDSVNYECFDEEQEGPPDHSIDSSSLTYDSNLDVPIEHQRKPLGRSVG